ncbi:FAD-dependent monooxygenase [Candidatus Liberibacter americanus]|uniref:2-polyprenyl-6-methoxyphenol hydroxylase n=1 Tax=Candidatus Liberibacter americanus str. Sao Paulo TaxID=1261131 RepID=U6B9B2_9HYPH|nr:FAD-dependent monooxygenase [Candidatus Liberibacter americanus]AHA28307.1 2-polyprenyl-6-methoxyphenol hydroxylase [Candidatus Liberibacter americanus str. Sao Paulo]EMS36599.1 monooxygenase FAD-binding protein [Candidatus Liberibacter americanus PW_SP]
MYGKNYKSNLPSVAIVGAGISGLSLAISLCDIGIKSHILEKKDKLSEKGFGLQISPNASRILKKIGIIDELKAVWIEPKEFIFLSGLTLNELCRIPCKEHAMSNWNGDYGVVKRSTLQRILLSKINSQSLAKLHLSTYIKSNSLTEISHITNKKIDLLVGADGVNSNIRKQIDNKPLVFSGHIVLRATIPKNEAPEFIDSKSVSLFLGADSHMVTYPLREDDTINIVAVSSNHFLDKIHLLKENQLNFHNEYKELFSRKFMNWNNKINNFITNILHTSFYQLFECKCSRWHNSKDTVLIGDAAHTFLPFAAQGANMAIEDAYLLSRLLKNTNPSEAITKYQNIRAKRINNIYSRTNFNGLFYHLNGPMRLCRDIALRFGPRSILSKSVDWIYNYNIQI